MKKFTNISGAKVGENPKPMVASNEELELQEFRNSVMKLIDDFLTIRSYGVARPETMIPTRIVGKELFVEALGELLSQKSSKDVTKALESLKSVNKDWQSIEEKIDLLKIETKNIKEEKKIKEIIEKWGSDEETLKGFLNDHVSKITKEEAYQKYQLVESMIKKSNDSNLKIVSDKYFERYKSE